MGVSDTFGTPLKKCIGFMLVVYIDCGHNKQSVGAVSADKELLEYKYVREIARHLKAFITMDDNMKLGYCHLTEERRGNTEKEDINLRVKAFNHQYAMDYCARSDDRYMLVSLHCDSSLNKDANGMSVYVAPISSDFSRNMAVISEGVIEEMSMKGNRWFGKENYKCRTVNAAILRDTVCPAVLFECKFLSNKDDVEYLKHKDSPQHIASCIFRCLSKYYFSFDQ